MVSLYLDFYVKKYITGCRVSKMSCNLFSIGVKKSGSVFHKQLCSTRNLFIYLVRVRNVKISSLLQ